MVIDATSAVKSYNSVAQAGRDADRARESREDARQAAIRQGNEATQVTLSQEARQAQRADQIPQRERVNGNDPGTPVREDESAAVARRRDEGASGPGGGPEPSPDNRRALAAYRDTSRV